MIGFNNDITEPVELSRRQGTAVSPVHQPSSDSDSTTQYLAQARYGISTAWHIV